MRFDWHDGTQVNAYFSSKGDSKSSVAIQHTKLKSKGDIDAAKRFWSERFAALRELLS